tara:strand:- start:674 stop:820 length:147 start_codon:yes stop_codon:yes gene_type:complete
MQTFVCLLKAIKMLALLLSWEWSKFSLCPKLPLSRRNKKIDIPALLNV